MSGAPTGGFNDDAIKQGNYQAWEFEHFYKRSTASANATTVLNALATSLLSASALSGSIKLSDMKVTKTAEGGVVRLSLTRS